VCRCCFAAAADCWQLAGGLAGWLPMNIGLDDRVFMLQLPTPIIAQDLPLVLSLVLLLLLLL